MQEDGRVLGLDFGSKRTGLAVTDPSRLICKPLEIVEKANSSDGISTICSVIIEMEVTLVVVGLPLGLDGSDTVQTARSRSFAARLAQHTDVPVQVHDERYTSKLADQSAALTGSRAARDSLAACHMLEGWIKEYRHGNHT